MTNSYSNILMTNSELLGIYINKIEILVVINFFF